MTGQCACGSVTVTLQSPPEFINDCNCSLCRKSGGAWGYFSTSEVTVSGETKGFVRSDKTAPVVSVQSCPVCGCTTHFVLTEEFLRENPEIDHLGINMRLFDLTDLDGVEVRFPDGDGWSGNGRYSYRRGSITIKDGLNW